MSLAETPAKVPLQWTQTLALVQHNLHMACTTLDFHFFKLLQVHLLSDGTDHVGTLSKTLEAAAAADSTGAQALSADALLASLDKFNSVIAFVHEDAFKSVHDAVTRSRASGSPYHPAERERLRILKTDQRATAAASIDKMLDAASALIAAQPLAVQDAAARVFVLGTTFAADAVHVALASMHTLTDRGTATDPDDLCTSVQSTVGAAVTGMKAVFKLMAATDPADSPLRQRRLQHTRSASIDNQTPSLLRRMSTALSISSITSPPSPSRKSSTISLGGGTASPPLLPPSKLSSSALLDVPLSPEHATESPFKKVAFKNQGAFGANSAGIAGEDDEAAQRRRRGSDSVAPDTKPTLTLTPTRDGFAQRRRSDAVVGEPPTVEVWPVLEEVVEEA